MMRFGWKKPVTLLPETSSKAFDMALPKVLILLIFWIFIGDFEFLQKLPA
jgi:hypothetical protein